MARKQSDNYTLELFASQQAPEADNDLGQAVRDKLKTAIRQSPLNRAELAIGISQLVGARVTKHSLDAWTADSREGWRFPLEYLWAFESVCHTRALTSLAASGHGLVLASEEDCRWMELGRLHHQHYELGRRVAQVRSSLQGKNG